MKTNKVLLSIELTVIILLFAILSYGSYMAGFLTSFVFTIIGILIACIGSLLVLHAQLRLSLNISKNAYQFFCIVGGVFVFFAGIGIIYIGNSGSLSLFCFN